MYRCFLLLVFMLAMRISKSQQAAFSQYEVYKGDDLGLVYSFATSQFRIWSPVAEEAELILYKEGMSGKAERKIAMQKSEGGTWLVMVNEELKGKFYVFRVKINGKWMNEVPDPYAKAVGVNGKRAMVVDLKETDPPGGGWQNDKSPIFPSKTDAVIYELHIRDASISPSSGTKQKGKFLGLAEKETKNKNGLSTGLDHLKEMGVTHIHLLPFFDFYSIDESKPDKPQYNWGYDPLNYNAPDGSYSSNPYDGNVRIKEFKQLVKTLHENGLRVVMDVVYNHTRLTEDSYFNQLVPGYYYRQNARGGFSDATACGNEIASERYMVRKFILESVLYWVKEYHIDGFRFDLMGVHDIETMNLVSEELHKIKPDILLYGEGWTAGSSPLPDSLRALKANASKLDRIAVFSDDIRDGIKGHVFTHDDKGFVSGKPGREESIKFGVVAACQHPQLDYSKVNYSKAPYAAEPFQTITYCECHDNHVLWDRLILSAKSATVAERKEMYKLALSIVLTSQGIPFLHAGAEFLRSKKGVENSFESPDSINAIDWNLKTKNKDVVQFVKAMIKLRKDHPAFRMQSADDIRKNIRFEENLPGGVVAYTIKGATVKDSWKNIFVVYNGSSKLHEIILPEGKWKIALIGNKFVKSTNLLSQKLKLPPHSCTILYQ